MENSQDQTALTTPAFVVKKFAENPLQVINSLHFCWPHISCYLQKPDFSCLCVLQPWESDCCWKASLRRETRLCQKKGEMNHLTNMLKPSCVLIAPAFSMANFFNSVQTEVKRREAKGFHPLQFASTRECATSCQTFFSFCHADLWINGVYVCSSTNLLCLQTWLLIEMDHLLQPQEKIYSHSII